MRLRTAWICSYCCNVGEVEHSRKISIPDVAYLIETQHKTVAAECPISWRFLRVFNHIFFYREQEKKGNIN